MSLRSLYLRTKEVGMVPWPSLHPSIPCKCIDSIYRDMEGVLAKLVKETNDTRSQVKSQKAAATKTLRSLLVDTR